MILGKLVNFALDYSFLIVKLGAGVSVNEVMFFFFFEVMYIKSVVSPQLGVTLNVISYSSFTDEEAEVREVKGLAQGYTAGRTRSPLVVGLGSPCTS